MKNLYFFLLLFFFGAILVYPQSSKGKFSLESYSKIHKTIENAFDGIKGKENIESVLLSTLKNAKATKNEKLIAYAHYSLARLNFEAGSFKEAKNRLDSIFKVENKIEDIHLLALSHILLAKISLKNHDFSETETQLLIAEKTVSELGEILHQQQVETYQQINFLSKKNLEQQNSLEFNQLAVILGATMIILFSLLSLAVFKNRKIRLQTTTLLRKKNKQLTIEKNNAEAATKAKTQFLSNITHELRTPVYAVTGLAQLLSESGNPNTEQKDYLNSLKFSGEHLLSLINNILDFNKLEAGKVIVQASDFYLKTCMENIVSTLQKSALDKNDKLHLEIDKNLTEKIIGDRVKLSQALINLISNAIRFTENGDIWIRAQLLSKDSEKVSVNFEIEDNGVGIAKENQLKIFDNFDQGSDNTSNKYGGTGLGLPIVKGILKIMGGKIKVESTPDVGSKFSFSLNFYLQKSDEATEAEEKILLAKNLKNWQEDLEGKRILIVEDNKINQMVTQKILSKHGVHCEIADSGEKAVEMQANNLFDLILMDINMPGIGGIEATKQIRETGSKTPIIALTAATMEEEINIFLNKGFNDIIPKPYKTVVFFKKINLHINASK